jgi:DNA-binding CsgD family transcriptional regulator
VVQVHDENGGAGPGLLGRESLLEDVTAFWAGSAGVLCLVGPAGIGKTALWRAAVDAASTAGWSVLRASPAEAERDMPYAVLADLLTGVLDDPALDLPAPQRRALEVALLLRAPEGTPPDPHGVGLATTAVLRARTEATRLVLAVDDLQWADRASTDALRFALRRLPADRVRAVLAIRTGDPTAPAPRLDPEATTLVVGPLALDDTRRLLARELSDRATAAVARRLHESALGNPLHTLELARAVAHKWPWTIDSVVPPPPLADLLRQRVDGLPESTRRALLMVAAMSRPSTGLLGRALGADPVVEVRRAVAAGLVRTAGDRLAFVHPLYAAACYRDAPTAERAAVHARLAEVVTDPERRARHLALAADGPDVEVAARLDAAAEAARARGAPHAAADLAELARAHTPVDDEPARIRRTRALADHLVEAGECNAARHVLEAMVAAQQPGPERARTRVALASVAYEDEGVAVMRAILWQALEEAAGDPAATAEAHLVLSRAEMPAVEAVRHAEHALAWFERLGGDGGEPDPARLADALRQLAVARWQLGRGISRELMARAAALEEGLERRPPVEWRAWACYAECLKYHDGFDEADRILAECDATAELEGDLSSTSDLASHRAELALWLGRWPEARTHVERAVEAARLAAQGGRLGMALCFRTLVLAHLGDAEGARADAAEVIDAALREDNVWRLVLARGWLGLLELSLGDARAAADQLDQVDALLTGSPVFTEPRQWRYLGDHVEALVRTGQLDRAGAAVERMAAWADRVAVPSAHAGALRARALLAQADGDLDRAVTGFVEATAAYAALPLPFEQARTALLLGTARRQARQRREAREDLARARARFAALGAARWLERAEEELGRLGGRTRSDRELTASEQRVADLAVAGMTNKEIAAALVVTPRTVEAHLTRIYAKLGVRSRVELTRLR